MIKDSGERREFETGAVRDIQAGKGRCDLMPLDVIGYMTADQILFNIAEFMRTGEDELIYNTILQFCNSRWGSCWTGMLELSKHYEDGAVKYGEHNWEKGILCHSYVDSAVRHYFKYQRCDDDEPHDRAFIWNLVGLLWTIKHKPELNDLPFAK